MRECDELEIWPDVQAGSKLNSQASAENEDGKSDDYNAHVSIKTPSGATIIWTKKDLDPGPASLTLVEVGSYGVATRLFSGLSGPTAKLRVWIEPPSEETDCTRTNSAAGTELHGSIVIEVS